MEELEERLARARQDTSALDSLLRDYLPFIKKKLSAPSAAGLEYDDRLSLGMLTFVGCVRQYEPGRGGFLAFAETCIKNRLLDESRRQHRRTSRVVPLFPQDEDAAQTAIQDAASLEHYDRERERQLLSEEIEALSVELRDYGVTWQELCALCPKQDRARRQCAALAAAVADDPAALAAFQKSRRVPQAMLSQKMGVSPKTVEKHRKYIVALILLKIGDYPGIRTFLPQLQGGD